MENKTDWWLVLALCLFMVYIGVSAVELHKFHTKPITQNVKR